MYDYLELGGDRLTDDERRMIRDRVCIMLTGFGLPGMTWCRHELTSDQVAHGQILCDEHEQDERGQYGSVVRLTPDDARRVFLLHDMP